MKSILRSSAILIISISIYGFAIAQSGGYLRGIVVDSKTAPVRGARVVLLVNDKQAIRETFTNNRGIFELDGLKPGDYAIVVEADGLTQTGGAQPVKIAAGREFRVAIPLTVAAIQDSIVVSSTKTETRTDETPVSAFVISANDMERAQQINIFDALRHSPGVTVAQTGRRGGVTSLFVRGGESDYTKVLIDGAPVNDAGGFYDFADLTGDDSSRIELIRGSQSALYGSDAMTGVLQLISHRGSTSVPEFEFAGEGGSFAFNRQFARVSGANGPFDYSTSFTRLGDNGRGLNDDYQARIASANLGYAFNTRMQMRVTARSENSGLGDPGATASFFPDPDERDKRRRITTGVRFDDQTTKSWRQSLSFAYSESDFLNFDPVAQDLTRYDTPPISAPFSQIGAGGMTVDSSEYINNHFRRRGLRYQTDLADLADLTGFAPLRGHFITAGLEYEEERAVFDSGFDGLNRVAPMRRNSGAFVQDQFSYTTRLVINAGVRVENDRASVPDGLSMTLNNLGSLPYTGKVGFGTEVVPKIGALVLLWRAGLQSLRGPTRLRVNYGEGIKAPSMIEAFSQNPLLLGNPDLKPERSRNFDIGLEQFLWKDHFRIEGVYFKNRFLDQVTFIADPATLGGPVRIANGALTNFINDDRATAQGVELTISTRPNRWLRFDGNYTLLNSKLDAAADIFDSITGTLVRNPDIGLPLYRRPRNSGSATVAFTGEKVTAALDGAFIGRRRDYDPAYFSRFDSEGRPIYNGGYTKLDLAGSYRLNSYMSLFGRVENLLNQDYQEVLGYPSYRLNFSAGMRFRIGGGR
ncbi:MAG: TonB-dependent receptor [Chloracidobacterium sp.]|nr:TonB-dependent receptor [Chloracidobacterium sp.]